MFNVKATIRLTLEQIRSIKTITQNNPDLYDNINHFIRCSIIKNINNHAQAIEGVETKWTQKSMQKAIM